MSERTPQDQTIILRAETVSKRKPPLNLIATEARLFDHELERCIPQTNLVEFKDVYVSSDGILFKGRKILTESFAFPSSFSAWKRRSVVRFLASNYLIKKSRTFEKEAAWIVDEWSYGYFHWLTDALSRLFMIRDRLNDLTLLLPHTYRKLEFVQASLKAFAVRNVEFTTEGEALLCSKLVLPTHAAPSGHYRDEVIKGVRDVLVGCYENASARPSAKRIYISRAGAPKRKIVNESEVVSVLREFDFEVTHAEDRTFEEQVKLFAQAGYVVSNHGAGLTNMLFMPQGGNVLELRHITDNINNCYFTLASALKQNYYYQTCAPEHAGEDAHTADLNVDVSTLRKNLESMLKM